MDISRAQNLLQKNGNISVIELQIADVFSSETIAKNLRTKWPKLKIDTWQSSNKQLLSGLKSQSSSSIVIQFFVQLAVLLGISSVLAISVVQKSKLIGILKAMGLKNYRVGRIFLLQGLLLGLLGSITGCLVGYGLIKTFLYATSISGAEISFVITTTPINYFSSITVATIASILAAFLPARRASSFNPIEVIRNG
jgi:lipoprotein-releasing system permease protein